MQLLSLACPGGDGRQILGRGSGQPASRCSPKERAPLLAEPPQHLRSQQERGHPRAKCQGQLPGLMGSRTLHNLCPRASCTLHRSVASQLVSRGSHH